MVRMHSGNFVLYPRVASKSGTTVVVGDNDKITVIIPGGGDVTIVADPGDAVDRIQVTFGGDLESDSVAIDLSSFSQNG